VAEFDGLADPVVALQASDTASAPFLLLQVDTRGLYSIGVRYDLRDLDSSADDAVQHVALQYRIGSSGDFINLPAGYVADASQGPNLAGLITSVDVVLPAAADNQLLVQLRIITSNATGNDEWIGVDNIKVTSGANHAPTCTIGNHQDTTDENGLQNVAGWITNCSANDPGQTASFSISTDKPELFTAAPAVDASGKLTYDPAPNVRGTAIVTITIKDNGGTASGGKDETIVTVPFNVDKPHPRLNAAESGPRRGLDVAGPGGTPPDGKIVAEDVITIVNYINAKGSGRIPDNGQYGPPYVDVTGDGQCAADDVIKVVNYINAHPGQSEGEAPAESQLATTNLPSDLISLLSLDIAEQASRRRRTQ